MYSCTSYGPTFGGNLGQTTFTHQTMLWIQKLLSPTVVLLTLSPRGTQFVIVHFLPEKETSLRLILMCFTRQLLEAQIVVSAYFKYLISGRRVRCGRENWGERSCFFPRARSSPARWFSRLHRPRAWNRLLIIFWHCYCRVIDYICRRRKLSKMEIGGATQDLQYK